MRDSDVIAYRVVILTLDAHIAGPAARAELRLQKDFPGLEVTLLTAAEWGEDPGALDRAKLALAHADMVFVNLLFLDEHVRAILPALEKARARADCFVGCITAGEIVRLTRMGPLDMGRPASGLLGLLKRLRGSSKNGAPASGERQMKTLRRLPKILRLIPGKAQDVRAYFLCMQYWLGGSDDNVEMMIRMLLSRYSSRADWRGGAVADPVIYPEVGVYHPRMRGRVSERAADLPKLRGAQGTVGLLLMRSYVLAGDTAHYDAVIDALERRGLRVVPCFASGLDNRPAVDRFLKGAGLDVLLSLTGFSLVGGPAFNDADAAVGTLRELDVTYMAAHPLEFQTIEQWQASDQGLGPVETTMLIALPEIDGATNPSVFAGRHGLQDRHGAMQPCDERIKRLADRVEKAARLHRCPNAQKRVAVVLYGFPPNSGAVGSAAHLAVWESLWNTLNRMRDDGYLVDVPATVADLRAAVVDGNSARFGQEANVLAKVGAEDIVANDPHLREIEAQWGAAPGRAQSDGSGVFVLGAQFGNVVVGLQPGFGYEGDPMRLLFEKGFAPTHAFSTFYRWLRTRFEADAVLHFGMHGALEFMPGKQTGLGATCWPDRLIGDLPNVYLYAANNPSEATLAKRRSGAVTISHLTPPLAQAGLYKGLAELRDSLGRWRELPDRAAERGTLAQIIADQAAAVDLDGSDPDGLWLTLLETSDALLPEGLHVVGRARDRAAIDAQLAHVPDHDDRDRDALRALLARDTELPAIMDALAGRYIAPVHGGDLIRSPDILPTGRNIHAFDPFRMPTAYAMAEGRAQVAVLLRAHAALPRTVAMVLWGSDNIKSDGGPMAQALALLGARPRFDAYGRLAGAELVPLAELGRPRIDVIVTLSGIFRDLLPLQVKLLAEAAWLAATADEPADQNFVRAHALAYAERMGVDLETAALRVFSNAEGAYGSNVNHLIDSGAWTDEDQLANAYEARKSYAYGRDGKAAKQAELLQTALGDVDLAYQNLESVELGVTTMDHYFDTLGGINRAVKRARGTDTPVYIGDQTRGDGKVRTLADQVALESRTRSLNPKWFEGMLKHGAEGVRQIEAQVTNTMGWSATTGQVDPWVYQRLSETFVLDEDMKNRLADLNPVASAKMANRLLEAHERNYWQADAETLEALIKGAEELEDRMEGVYAAE
ncbi:MAG: cobaltochelatase subunit CobN [Pseudomonadota bacterium]